jgi:hypothetical protein
MNNQLLFFGLVVAAVLVFLLVSGTFDPYKKSTAFSSGNDFITLDSEGNIKLQPVADVDKAIDAAADSVAADVAVVYKTKVSAEADKRHAEAKYQPKGFYQPRGNYLVRGQYYKMWNKLNDDGVWRDGYNLRVDQGKRRKNETQGPQGYFKLDN